MTTLILYDSIYGNTKLLAKAMGSALAENARVLSVSEAALADLNGIDVLIVGSPVHGGRPTPRLDSFLKTIPDTALKGKKVAAFDTRFAAEDQGIGIRILMSVIRYAAERIAHELEKKGGRVVGKAHGFIVENKEGPLKKGEIERAIHWAKEVSQSDRNKKRIIYRYR